MAQDGNGRARPATEPFRATAGVCVAWSIEWRELIDPTVRDIVSSGR